MWQERLTEFITLWVVIDPLGSLSVFLAVTATLDRPGRRKAAVISIAVAFLVLLFFIIAGQMLLRAMGISLLSFQIAGAVVLFLFALQMIHGTVSTGHYHAAPPGHVELAVYPLAIPVVAGPGAMLAVVVLTDNSRHNVPDQAFTVVVVAVVLILTLLLLLLAERISR